MTCRRALNGSLPLNPVDRKRSALRPLSQQMDATLAQARQRRPRRMREPVVSPLKSDPP